LYAIVDIETTGGHAASNGITEIAIFLHDGERVYKKFNTLINPGYSIPPYISRLTGITDKMVAEAPSFDEVSEIIYELLHDKIFVAHNVSFDYSFVKHHLNLRGFELNVKRLCTVRLSRKAFSELPSYSLGNLCRALGIEVTNRHRAAGDAHATALLFSMILEKNIV